jgi:hypothetical protein
MTKRLPNTDKTEAVVKDIVKTAPAVIDKEKHRGIKLYCPEIVEEILVRVSEGATLSSVCNDERMPTWRTVHRWMSDYPDFARQVEQARELSREYNLDKVVDIADAVTHKDEVPVAKIQTEQRWRVIKRIDRMNELDAKRPVDPKTINAAVDENNAWTVDDNGEPTNPMRQALDAFRKKHGLPPRGT